MATDYRCGNCGKRYRRPDPSWSYCAQHGRGECCHFGEVRITKHGKVKDRREGDHPLVLRIGDPYPIGSGSTTSAPWCGICGGFHIPGFGACTATYS